MTFGNPDFVVYAKSYGINGARGAREKNLTLCLDNLDHDCSPFFAALARSSSTKTRRFSE